MGGGVVDGGVVGGGVVGVGVLVVGGVVGGGVLVVGGGVLVVGGVVGGVVVGDVVVGVVVVGVVVVGDVVVGGGVIGKSVVDGMVMVCGTKSSRAPALAGARRVGGPVVGLHDVVGPSVTVGSCVGVAVRTRGERVEEAGAAFDGDLSRTRARLEPSPFRPFPSPVARASPFEIPVTPVTSGAWPKISTRTSTQSDTAPVAMSAGVDRVSARRRRANVVGGGGGGATPTDLRCLPDPTTAYPMSIRARLRSDGSD